uniref:Uncharacterized protein n=1 Tax=Anguilla anguilla TaxID=7936 RepID=A0A0E9W573_ANGAN
MSLMSLLPFFICYTIMPSQANTS